MGLTVKEQPAVIESIALTSEWGVNFKVDPWFTSSDSQGYVRLKSDDKDADRVFDLDDFESFCEAGLKLVAQIREGRR